MSKKISIGEIKIDVSVYPRNGVSDFNVIRLVNALKSGAKLPPITVEARTHRLVDGRHRYESHIRAGMTTIDCVEKSYVNEADLFADAVRLNAGHGEPLNSYNIRNAIIRLTAYGYERTAISEVVRLPLEQIEKIERGFATSQDGKPLALKGGLNHMRGEMPTPQQVEVNRHYSGGKATFYVRQICELIDNGMAPRSAEFAYEMNRLVSVWRAAQAEPSKPSDHAGTGADAPQPSA